jgi:hypothetical protein
VASERGLRGERTFRFDVSERPKPLDGRRHHLVARPWPRRGRVYCSKGRRRKGEGGRKALCMPFPLPPSPFPLCKRPRQESNLVCEIRDLRVRNPAHSEDGKDRELRVEGQEPEDCTCTYFWLSTLDPRLSTICGYSSDHKRGNNVRWARHAGLTFLEDSWRG